VSKCETKPIVGTSCSTLEGKVAITYEWSSIVTSSMPIAFNSSTNFLAKTHCFSVLGVVSEFGSDSESIVT
jgi:hypothetical protein